MQPFPNPTILLSEVFSLNQPLVSPSLWKPENVDSKVQNVAPYRKGAYEIKFLIDEAMAEQLRAFVSVGMQSDPYSDPATGGYSVEGIYFDTAECDVYRRTPGYSRRKYRIRRYSEGPNIFLERKAKRKGIVTKRRIQLEDTALGSLLNPIDANKTVSPVGSQSTPLPSQPVSIVRSDTDWFRKRLERLRLQPTLCLTYDRIAFLTMDCDGPIRLTIDRNLGCCKFQNLSFPSRSHYQRILEGKCVVEMKFRETLPTRFREFIDAFKLIACPVSKFRNAVQACGLAPSSDPNPDEGTN